MCEELLLCVERLKEYDIENYTVLMRNSVLKVKLDNGISIVLFVDNDTYTIHLINENNHISFDYNKVDINITKAYSNLFDLLAASKYIR